MTSTLTRRLIVTGLSLATDGLFALIAQSGVAGINPAPAGLPVRCHIDSPHPLPFP